MRQETEIWVRQDGTVYARNLTSGMAAVLATLDGEDAQMRWRARAGEEGLEQAPVRPVNAEGER